jgi:hypothetical protein
MQKNTTPLYFYYLYKSFEKHYQQLPGAIPWLKSPPKKIKPRVVLSFSGLTSVVGYALFDCLLKEGSRRTASAVLVTLYHIIFPLLCQ